MVLEYLRDRYFDQKPRGGVEFDLNSIPFYSYVTADVGILKNINLNEQINVSGLSHSVKGMLLFKENNNIIELRLYHNHTSAPGEDIKGYYYTKMSKLAWTDTKSGQCEFDIFNFISSLETNYTSLSFDLDKYLQDYPFTLGLSGSAAKIIHHNTDEVIRLCDIDKAEPRDIDLVVHPKEEKLIEEFKQFAEKYPSSGSSENISFKSGHITYDVFISDQLCTVNRNNKIFSISKLSHIQENMKKYNRPKDIAYFDWLDKKQTQIDLNIGKIEVK